MPEIRLQKILVHGRHRLPARSRGADHAGPGHRSTPSPSPSSDRRPIRSATTSASTAGGSRPPARRRYFLMNKPRGYITSRSDPQRRPTVIDLLAKHGIRDYVYPVGRLDYDSEGLLILTSDGELAGAPDAPESRRRAGVRGPRAGRTRRSRDRAHRAGRGGGGSATAPADVQRTKVFEGRTATSRRCCRSSSTRAATVRSAACARRSAIPSCGCVGCASGRLTDARLRPGDFREPAEEVAALKKHAVRAPPARARRGPGRRADS